MDSIRRSSLPLHGRISALICEGAADRSSIHGKAGMEQPHFALGFDDPANVGPGLFSQAADAAAGIRRHARAGNRTGSADHRQIPGTAGLCKTFLRSGFQSFRKVTRNETSACCCVIVLDDESLSLTSSAASSAVITFTFDFSGTFAPPLLRCSWICVVYVLWQIVRKTRQK